MMFFGGDRRGFVRISDGGIAARVLWTGKLRLYIFLHVCLWNDESGIDVVFFIQELYMKFGDFIFILFFKMKVFVSEFFDKFFDFFADFFLVTPCHCNHFVQFLSNGLWLFSGSLLMVCTIWNFSTTQWGYCGWFAHCFTNSVEGLTFESKMILNVVSSFWVGISRKYVCLISISLL